jgi:hypothetical protein
VFVGAPPSLPPDGVPSHVPTLPVVELHLWPDGHPLPPMPTQPTSQAFVFVLQTRPGVDVPQSLSVAQPHVSFARQAEPDPLARQLPV